MSEQLLWKQIKETLQRNCQGKLLHSVLNTATFESSILKGQKEFVLKVPSTLHQQILKNHLSAIQTYIKNKGLSFRVNIQKTHDNTQQIPVLKQRVRSTSKKEKLSSFSQHWTFSSFIQGPENCFASSLTESIARKPTQNNTNPLFIYGPSGIGKTHLLHAIGNYLEKEKPQTKVHYLPAERFFNDCISHIRKNEMPLFRQKYRTNIQVLLLDDIQILGKGESTQEEFFHTFENLKQNGCQIVLACDQKPANIKGLKERIKTRFEGGVVAEMRVPDKDTKIAIIKSKSQKYQLHLSQEMISHIAGIPTRSVRELEGSLNKIKIFCELQNKRVSLHLIQELLNSPVACCPPAIPPLVPSYSTTKDTKIRLIQKEVCNFFHIKLSEMKSRSRTQRLVQARNIAMHIIQKNLGLSSTEIGWHFGKRNHSTVLSSLKNLKNQQTKNTKISNDIKSLKNIIHKKTRGVKNI